MMDDARMHTNSEVEGLASTRVSKLRRFWLTRWLELQLFYAPAPWKRGSVFHSMAQHPGIWIPCWALHLIVIWWLGRKFGLPLLFWHDDPWKAFVAGVICALTFGFFFFVFFVLDYSSLLKETAVNGGKEELTPPHWTTKLKEHFARYREGDKPTQPSGDTRAASTQSFGDEVELQSFLFRSLTNAFAYLITGLFLLRLGIYFMIHPPGGKLTETSASHGNFDIWSESMRFDLAWWVFLGGLLVGAILVLVLDMLKFALVPGLNQTAMGDRIPIVSWFDAKQVWSKVTAMMVLGGWAFLILLGSHLCFFFAGEAWGQYYAAPAICIMLAWFVFCYAVVVVLVRGWYGLSWLVAILALFAGALLLPSLNGRYGFKNLSASTAGVKELPVLCTVYPRKHGTMTEKEQMDALAADRQRIAAEIGQGKVFGNREAKAEWGQGPMVVICASGGGITAEVWTLETLELLSRSLTGFAPSVRLITGASGGMVGAAAWAGGRYQAHAGRENVGFPEKKLLDRVYDDQLSPLALRFALFDSGPHGFLLQRSLPALHHFDRGESLEETWLGRKSGNGSPGVLPELAAELGKMEKLEHEGAVPSLLFSPTIAEQGRPLLISNLDVSLLTYTDLPGPFPDRRIDRVHRAVDARQLLGEDRIQNTPVSTWARMSATFPLVSPAGSIDFALNPEDPGKGDQGGAKKTGRIHLVDAAYADNQGTSLAVAWLRRYWLPWARQSESAPRDVILIEIDAFPRYSNRAFDDLTPTSPYLEGVKAAVEDINVPLTGLGNRMKTHLFHTDRMMEEFAEEVASTSGSAKGLSFTTYRFVNPIPCSLSWSLSAGERSGLQWFHLLFEKLGGMTPEALAKLGSQFDQDAVKAREQLVDLVNREANLRISPVNAKKDPVVLYSVNELVELVTFWQRVRPSPPRNDGGKRRAAPPLISD